MSKKEKTISRFLSSPKDFTWDELTYMLGTLNFKPLIVGKTGGSRRKFYNEEVNLSINLHKPHPENTLKSYQVKQIKEFLIKEKLI